MTTTLALATSPRWRPTPFLWGSAALHAAALAALALNVPWWPWVLAVVAINHVAITLAGLWPRSDWLGDNICRLPVASAARGEWALTIDDGPDPDVTPAVLDILDAHAAKATFFCIAARVAAHPALAQQIVARGHSIQNHSHGHPHSFSIFGRGKIERELREAQSVLVAVTGSAPRYFRAPAGLRNIFLAPVLHRMGLRLVSWSKRAYDTRETRPPVILERLTPALDGGAILLLHDGHAARDANGRAVILTVLPPLLDRAQAQGLTTVTLPQALGA